MGAAGEDDVSACFTLSYDEYERGLDRGIDQISHD